VAIRTAAEPPSVAGPHAQLAQAVRRVYQWPARLAGFGATVLLHDAHDVHLGRLEVRGPHDVDLHGRLPVALHGWSARQLCALVRQHWPGGSVEVDGAAEVTVADDEPNHPLGAVLSVGDPLRTSFRVRDGRVTEVVRHTPGEVTRVAVLGWASADDAGGELLPTAVVTTHADPASGALTAMETAETSWIRVDGVPLPAHRRVVRQGEAGCVTRELELVEHAVRMRARG
jgi:hypothetical protein